MSSLSKKLSFLIVILILILSACSVDSPAKLVILESKFEVTNNGDGVFSFTVTNKGELPAFQVIVMADAMRDGKSVGYREREIGTLFSGDKHTDTLRYLQFGYLAPDSVHLMMTYTPYNAY